MGKQQSKAEPQTQAEIANPLAGQPAGRYDDEMVRAFDRLRAKGISFTEMSVTMLAKEIGVSRVTFYSHYGDKRRCVIMLAERTGGEIAAEVEVWHRFAERLTFDELYDVLNRIMAILETHRTTMDLLIETSTYDEELGQFYLELRTTIGDMIGAVITKLQEAGRCDASLDPGYGIILSNMFERNFYDFAAAPGRERDPELVMRLAKVYWYLLYCKHDPQ